MFKKKVIAIAIAVVVFVSSGVYVYASSLDSDEGEIKNVIVLIGDGMSVDGITLTRWYNAYDEKTNQVDTSKTLAMDEMASGLVRTYWQSNGVVGAITDSAPAGTALATGNKTMDKYIGVSDKQAPLATILEVSKNAGKATGLVSTSQIMHATPAAFSSHYPDRSEEEIIAEQQVYNDIDVMLGGGSIRLQNREDNEDLIETLKSKGYTYMEDKAELEATKLKTWGMFAELDLAYEMDKPLLKPEQPTLQAMTQIAIDTLSKDKDGFFLMVESSKVDWAAHANDPIGMISEINALDDATKVALDYAKKHNDTMIIVITDHGNSGITIGNEDTSKTYSKDGIVKFVEPLKKATLTGAGVATKLTETNADIKQVMAEFGGVDDLSDEEIEMLESARKNTPEILQALYGKIIAKRAYLGFTTSGHTGEDIVLYSYLPNNQRITGTINNVDIPLMIAKTWNLDLTQATNDYYVNAAVQFKNKQAEVTVNTKDTTNPTMTVKKGNNTLEIEENKNYVVLNGKKIEIPNVTVQIEGRFYVNKKVIDLIN